jgi:hypothetical protein
VAAKTVVCPNCHTLNVPQALFCESCGYDFMTGQVPENPWAANLVSLADFDSYSAVPEPGAAPEPDQAASAPLSAADEAAALAQAIQAYQADNPPDDGQAGFGAVLAEAEPAVDQPAADEQVPLEWVAELWIDPDWYELEGSPDPLPSPGLPDIVPLLKQGNLIGRASASKQTYPEIDCDLDTGCSRRHAMLSTDGARWWIEDLDSANGTFVGPANGPLPSMPIPRGRVELSLDQRIYLGAWTRIVIRRATPDEVQAFGK